MHHLTYRADSGWPVYVHTGGTSHSSTYEHTL
jgi:hypothetical protein